MAENGDKPPQHNSDASKSHSLRRTPRIASQGVGLGRFRSLWSATDWTRSNRARFREWKRRGREATPARKRRDSSITAQSRLTVSCRLYVPLCSSTFKRTSADPSTVGTPGHTSAYQGKHRAKNTPALRTKPHPGPARAPGLTHTSYPASIPGDRLDSTRHVQPESA